MSESDSVDRAGDQPVTIESLAKDLRALGVDRGMTSSSTPR